MDHAPNVTAGSAPTVTALRTSGEVIVYRLYDLGYEIDLERASALLAGSAPERPRPTRGEAQAIEIPNPPVTVQLGAERMAPGERAGEVELSARVFDFGVVSMRARVPLEPGLPWEAFVRRATGVAAAGSWPEEFDRARQSLFDRLRPAITKPGLSPVLEDYVVFRIHQLTDHAGSRCNTERLTDEDIARLLLGEARPLSAATRRELLSPRFAYFEDDLAVLTWNAALVVEPVTEDTDVQYILEFANAQLLELRFYDALLDQELPRMYDRIDEARHGFHLLGRGYSRLLATLQTRVAEATELVERTENALKVTDDVFLARIYAAALEVFRGPAWRSGVDGKLAIVRDTYAMLNAESQARRSEILELTIVVLIVFEIVAALLWRS